MYLSVRRGCGVSQCQERLLCVLMSGVVVHLDISRGGVS